MAIRMRPASLSRRGLLRAAALAGGAAAGGGLSAALAGPAAAAPLGPAVAPLGLAAAPLGPANPALANDVRQEFLTAWTAYRRLVFGRDELRPLSGTGSDFFIGGVPMGLTIIESLDTMYLMELDGELNAAIAWINGNFSANRNASVHVFETIIRLVGGLLSGYHATGNSGLLTRARDLTDRLLPAFTRSPTGAPYRFVNLQTGAVSGNQVPLAEIGSNVTEFGFLSQVTGDPKYFNASKRALRAVWNRRSSLNLVGTTLNVETGAWTDTTARVDPPVDSFFEDLHGAHDMFGDTEIRGWYNTLTAAIVQRLAETVNGRLWFRKVNMNTGAMVGGRTQSELTAFYAGLLGQGGDLARGESYHNSWTAVLGRHRLPPESVDYSTLNALSNAYALRPEYIDSALFLWLLTGNEVYRTRAQDMWNRQKAHCKVANGYAVVNNMTTTPTSKGDITPGYWFSENMKYYYLMWAGAPRFNYANNYLTTEGNVLRGINRVGAPTPSGTFRLVNRAAGLAMRVDAASLADNARVVLASNTNTASRSWVTTTTAGASRLTNRQSGKVLEVPQSSTTPGTQLVQFAHNGTNTQQWTVQSVGGGFVTLVNRNSGLVAGIAGTASGSAVVQQAPTGGTGQQWQLVTV
ncbi:MAG TPA: glycoside hydrolase family 47 protein [Pilimelia sp.]|nr:glycoside hydrolase family 47 protein [Pilimelia sp.]